jgi:mono/diheme cytochrome c family protein
MNNRRFARTAGWLALPCLVAAGLLAWYVTREPASPFTTAATDPALVSRGEYVARLSDCVACHSLPGGAVRRRAGDGHAAGGDPRHQHHPDRDTASAPTAWPTSTAPCATASRPVVAGCTRRCPTRPTPSSATTTCARCTRFSCTACNRPSRPTSPAHPWPLNLRWPIALWNGLFAPTALTRPNRAGCAVEPWRLHRPGPWPLRQLPHAARPGVQREGTG